MALTINTNLEAINASRNLNTTENMLSSAMEHLSSGLRINTASDDVAGYAIANDLQSQVNGLNQASENILDAVALTQTAQGALNDVNTMLQRIRELAVQSENGTTSEAGKEAIGAEVKQLTEEINRVATTTEFNGTKLLEKAGEKIVFQVGSNEGEHIELTTAALATEAKTEAGFLEAAKGGGGGEVLKATALKEVTEAINAVSKTAGTFGAVQDRIQYTQSNLEVYSQNLESADSALVDVNMATEMTNFTKDEVLQQAGVAILAQANQLPDATLKLLE